ncbi:MAG: low affinity iron permease family protein [Pirellulales bacterium]
MTPETLTLSDRFRGFAKFAAGIVGLPSSFAAAIFMLLVWALSGPFYRYSDAWQLTINTSTSIITFLMVFLIQNTQERDARAMHLKLDELLRAVSEARNGLIQLEDLSDEQLRNLGDEFHRLTNHWPCPTTEEAAARDSRTKKT